MRPVRSVVKVDGPSLASVDSPTRRKVLCGLVDIGGNGVHTPALARSAHGNVNEFAPFAAGEDVGDELLRKSRGLAAASVPRPPSGGD